jgi:YggT family protein
MLVQIGSFLLEALFGFFVFLVLLRFLLQSFKVPFRNPIGQFTIALTDWIVKPLRRVVPPFRRHDLASIVAAWLLIVAKLILLMLLVGIAFSFSGLFLHSILDLMRDMLRLIMLIVIVHVVISWVNPHHPLGYIFDMLTRPFYRLFRFIKPVGQFDLSPLFLLLAINILLIILNSIEPTLLAAL